MYVEWFNLGMKWGSEFMFWTSTYLSTVSWTERCLTSERSWHLCQSQLTINIRRYFWTFNKIYNLLINFWRMNSAGLALERERTIPFTHCHWLQSDVCLSGAAQNVISHCPQKVLPSLFLPSLFSSSPLFFFLSFPGHGQHFTSLSITLDKLSFAGDFR